MNKRLTEENGDRHQAVVREGGGVVHQVTSLEGVGEWHPGQVAERQHEAKAILDDVHRSQDRRLDRSSGRLKINKI